MPRPRKLPESYTIAIEPNLLEIALASALEKAVAPLYEEVAQLRQDVSSLSHQQSALVEQQSVLVEQQQKLVRQQSILVGGFERLRRHHSEQLQQLSSSLRRLTSELDSGLNG